jgi:hypothetical protein
MKLAGALAVPLSALAVVTGLEVVYAANERTDVRDQTALAEIALGPTSILSSLEEERNAAGITMLGLADDFTLRVEDPAEGAQRTDAAIESFRAEVNRQGDDIIDAYAPAFEGMKNLADLREDVAATPEAERTLTNIEATNVIFEGWPSTTPSSARAPSSSTSTASRPTSWPSSCATC